ncbi:YybH family protein [Actinokineospora iranica]|uniref:DUF4440 domain-containing protein n=1 Tax=Actinokineospora iranica TaxID=1271860 RepID=A0A1G6S026_9PSEU|nr:DUF4440 domain-containing protein [Actinokineospora iranica]SDD09527.1 conserved hypothetical protein [Actinokineospora iranica]
MTSVREVLVTSVLEHAESYVRAFNSGDPAALDSHYTDDAVTVWEKGVALSGEARRAGMAEFLAQQPKITTTVLESHVTEDTALLVVDWTIDIPGGERLSGIGTDVLRRGAGGQWLFAIDNPYGKDI